MSNLAWVSKRMRLVGRAVSDLEETLHVAGLERPSVLLCSHVEWKFTYLASLLARLMEVTVVGNRTTTCRSDCVEELSNRGIRVFNTSGVSDAEHEAMLAHAASGEYAFVFDDGAKVIPLLSANRVLSKKLIAATEYTASGARRLRATELAVPAYNLNSSFTKSLIGNLYGTGISTLSAFLWITNVSPAGLRVGILGYGPVGQSVARAFRGVGSVVAVCEPRGDRCHLAHLDGFTIASAEDIAGASELIITCTGSTRVLDGRLFRKMRDGTVLANVGHDNYEIAVDELRRLATSTRDLTPYIREYTIEKSRRLDVLCDGTLLNLSAGLGFPIEIIDYSLAAAVALWAYAASKADRKVGFNEFPPEVDDKIRGWLDPSPVIEANVNKGAGALNREAR